MRNAAADLYKDPSIINPNEVDVGVNWRQNGINFLKQHIFKANDASLTEVQNSNNDRRLEGELSHNVAFKQDKQDSAVQDLRIKKEAKLIAANDNRREQTAKPLASNDNREDKKEKLVRQLKQKERERVLSRSRSRGRTK